MLTPALGVAEGSAVGLEVGVLRGIGESVGLDADGAGIAGGAVDVGSGVGTDTVGSAPEGLGAGEGLAACDGTGAAAISAVPAP